MQYKISEDIETARSAAGESGGRVWRGIWAENPLLVLALGLSPAIAMTTSAAAALQFGALTLLVIVYSNCAASLLRPVIPAQVRTVSYIVVAAAFTSLAVMMMYRFAPFAADLLGIFAPLTVVSCVAFTGAGGYAWEHSPLPAVADGFSKGLGCMLVLLLIGTIREVFGLGTILGVDVTFGVFEPLSALSTPVGGLLLLGLFAAAVRWAMSRRGKGKS